MAHLGGIPPEARDRERRRTEDFRLGDVDGAVEVEQVGRGPVGLVADLEALTMGPVDPTLEILEVEGSEGVAVIRLDSGEGLPIDRGDGGGVAGGEGGGVGLEIVAVPGTEDCGEPRRPAGVEVLE